MADAGLAIALPLFALAGIGVWLAGVELTRCADIIAERSGMGRAFTGVLLLGAATSLPEFATTATAALGNHPALAGNNLLGGIAMQMAVIALVDATVARGKAFTAFSPGPVFMMQGVMLIVLLAVATAALSVGEFASFGGIGFWSLLCALVYVLALYVMWRYGHDPRWQPSGDVAATEASAEASPNRYRRYSTARVTRRFAVASAGVLISGYLVAETGAAIAAQTGLGESFVGATLVAITTSLPEVSTTIAAVRIGAFGMAAGNILGTNALSIAMFLPADALWREGTLFDALDASTIFLAALGIAVTSVYLWGVLERRDRTLFGMGVDSVVVLILYGAGMLLYFQLGT